MVRRAPLPDLIDLHVHSSVSDGALSPREVVRLAGEVGLKAIALTDHDTVAGVAEALAASKEFGVEVIPGVEISTEIANGACHVLGYFVDHINAPLGEILEAAREGRRIRNLKILERLNQIGFKLTMDEVASRVKDGVLTRSHFAAALLEKGYARTWDEVFEKWLGHGKPAYVPRVRVTPPEAIRVIHGAGGLAVLAHPRQLNRGVKETDAYISELAAAGLDGVETHSSDHTPNLGRHYKATALRLGLVETGGTDWHGRQSADTAPEGRHVNIHLGLGRGSMAIHYTLVEAMKARLAQQKR